MLEKIPNIGGKYYHKISINTGGSCSLPTILFFPASRLVFTLRFRQAFHTNNMSLPTIIFVHGAWHWPGFFDKVKRILESKGYKTVTLSMPSVGREPPVTSMEEDIAVIRTAVMKELDGGNNVVINGHSMYEMKKC